MRARGTARKEFVYTARLSLLKAASTLESAAVSARAFAISLSNFLVKVLLPGSSKGWQ